MFLDILALHVFDEIETTCTCIQVHYACILVHTQIGVSLLQYQNGLNGGKCGVCGDPWGKPNPQFVAGGKYANGIITRTYKEGQVRQRNYTFIWKHIFYRVL